MTRALLRSCLVLAALVRSAHAGDGIALESYTNQRTEDANRLLSPVLDELAKRGFVAGAEVARKFESRVSRPSLVARGLTAEFADLVERGHKAWIGGKFDEAVQILGPLVESAHANPGAFAQNQPLREKLLKALIALALSQQRRGDPPATRATFAEILRSFPTTTLSRGTYGPEAHALFEEVRAEIAKGGRGKLLVKLTDESGAVFINEGFVNVGTTAQKDLLAGEYRVFVQHGKQLSRVHRVTVKANEEAVVTIDRGFDAVAYTSPAWAGLLYGDATERDRLEASYAAAFANAIEARAVVVVGIDRVKGRPAVIGVLVNLMNGREIRRASVGLDPDPPVDRLRALARFLAGDEPVPGIEVETAGDARSAPVGTGEGVQIGDLHARAHPRRGPWGGWKFITGGFAVAALATGGYLLAIDGDCYGDGCGNVYNTTAPAWATVGGGAVLAGITVYLVLRADGSSPDRAAFVVPTSGGALAGLTTRF